MPIKLDHVGLNTLIQEPVDEEQNSVGFQSLTATNVKALRVASGGSGAGLSGDLTPTYPTSGYLSISFWAKLDNGSSSTDPKYMFESSAVAGGGMPSVAKPVVGCYIYQNKLVLYLRNASNDYRGFITSNVVSATTDEWFHCALIISATTIEAEPILYVNGATLSFDMSSVDGSATGALNQMIHISVLDGLQTTSSEELQGAMYDLAFYNIQLDSTKVNEIINQKDNLTRLSFAGNILDYWKLGEEPEFNNFSFGQTVPQHTSFASSIGNSTLTNPNNNYLTIARNNKEPIYNYMNKDLTLLQNPEDYLAALNIHRNGPYGWPIFKQTRIGQNPLTRFHNRNSMFTYVPEVGEVKILEKDGNLIGSVRELPDLREIVESPVVSNYKPLTLIGSTKVESTRGGMLSKQRIEIKTSFSNETTYFADEQATRDHGVDIETVDNYEDFIDLYLDGGLDSDDSPFDEFEMLRTEQTIFPSPTNMYLGQVRSREEFGNLFWRDSYDNRVKKDVNSGYFTTIPSQSIWPLDYVNTNLPNMENIYVNANTASFSVGIGYKIYTQKFVSSSAKIMPEYITHEKKGSGILMQTSREYYFVSPRTSVAADAYFYIDFVDPGPAFAKQNNCQTFSASFNPYSTFQTAKKNSTGSMEGRYSFFPGYSNWTADTESGKTPFYDSYNEYSELIKGIGKDYSLIPEFKISDHVSSILNYGIDSDLYTNPLFNLTGAKSTYNDSTKIGFYKTYSTSDFLKNFELIQEDHEGFVDPLTIKLRCKAIKKFLPYEGFYPAQRTVEMAKVFYDSVVGKTTISGTADLDFRDSEYDAQFILQNLFAPGIMYNTIKSGVAVDYPIHTNLTGITSAISISHATRKTIGPLTGSNEYNEISSWYLNDKPLDTRIPFEAILEPGKYLSDKAISTLHPTGEANYGTVMASFKTDPEYYLMANNFLSETGDFFLKNEDYTTIASLPEGDPNFGNAQAGSTYMMRLKMYRSISGSKQPLLASNNVKYMPPQDNGNEMKESFSMYSRPTAFGNHYSSYIETSEVHIDSYDFNAWKEYKFDGCYNFSYNTGSYIADGTVDQLPDFQAAGNHVLIGNPVGDGYNYIFTPPYYHGEAWADFTFKPTESKKYSLSEIMENSSVEFYRYYDVPITASTFSGSSVDVANIHYRLVNESAMQLPSSVNIKSKGMFESDRTTLTTADAYRWIIQTKFETPMINFNHISYDDVPEIPVTYLSSSDLGVYTNDRLDDLQKDNFKERGIWKQYGRPPESSSIGVFMQVEDVDPAFIQGPMNTSPSDIKSLRELCGFSNNATRLGEIKESKIIKEAVVAVPFIEREGERKFFTLDRKDIKHALQDETQKLVGKTVLDQVEKMKEFVFPPSMDFLRNKDIEPFAMYIFEFTQQLSKQDLSDIWQNLSPDIGTSHEVSEASISHELLAHELLGSGAVLEKGDDENLKLNRQERIKEIPSDIRWMVFKAKKRAASNYFEKIYQRNESGFGSKEKLLELSSTSTGANLGVQHNWPYDFFSLVELVKIDAQVDFAIPDDENQEEKLVIKTIKKKTNVDTTPTENDAVINNALFGTGTPLVSPTEESPALEPEEPTPLGNVDRGMK